MEGNQNNDKLSETKCILSLIRFHYEKNEKDFDKVSSDLISYYSENGKLELAEYIAAQMGICPTFVPQ